MRVKCSKCGEELLGAVNRCWRCGTRVASRPGDTDLPPVRRAPIRMNGEGQPGGDSGSVEHSESIEQATTDEAQPDAAVPDTSPAGQPATANADDKPAVMARRVGSPFAVSDPETAAVAGTDTGRPKSYFPVTEAKYPRITASAGGAVAALVLGAMSLIFSFFTWLAIFTALIGLVMGIWGLYSTRRGSAIIGVLLCCFALAVGGFNGIVSIYTIRHGYAPWDAPSDSELYGVEEYEDEGDF